MNHCEQFLILLYTRGDKILSLNDVDILITESYLITINNHIQCIYHSLSLSPSPLHYLLLCLAQCQFSSFIRLQELQAHKPHPSPHPLFTLSSGRVDPPNITIVNSTMSSVVVTMYPVTSLLK